MITDFISPLVLENTWDTRSIYAALGLLVTMCWISCLLTNGAMVGCAISASRSVSRSCSAVCPAGTATLLKIVFAVVSCSASTGEHLAEVVRRIVVLRRGPRRGGIGPAGEDFRQAGDHRLVVSGDRIAVSVEHRASIGIQFGQAEGEELHQLARVILVGRGPFGRIRLVIVRHVQIRAHGGTQGHGFDNVAVISEGVVAEDPPVRWKRVGGMNRHLRHHPDLRKDERHALPQLVLPRHGVLEKRGLHCARLLFESPLAPVSAGPAGPTPAPQTAPPASLRPPSVRAPQSSQRRPPCRLIEKPGGRAIAHYRRQGSLIETGNCYK